MPLVNVTCDAGVVRIELNRPQTVNALSLQLAEDLLAVAAPYAARPDVKALVLSGAGRGFCAGADVAETPALLKESAYHQVTAHARMQRILEDFERLPVVKIARIHGGCVGAGLVLATLCELRVATPTAVFALPELAFGIPFSMAGLPRLARLIGPTRAADLLLTTRRVNGEEALAMGLVTAVATEDEIDAVVDSWASTVAAHPSYLVANAVTRLREVSESLARSDRSDLDALVLASMDPESARQSQAYAQSVVGSDARPG
jgi:enoyl-CoA hydratase/carnithine racemase